MGLVTNDEAVLGADGTRLVDAHTLLDEGNPLVLAHPKAFHPVPPASDEGVARTSAVYADPDLQAEGQPAAPAPPKSEEEREKRLAAAQASPPVVPTTGTKSTDKK